MEQKNTWETYDEKQLGEVDAFAREYMDLSLIHISEPTRPST